MMSESLDRDVIAGIDLNSGLQQLTKITPVNGLGGCGNVVVVGPTLTSRRGLGFGWRDERRAGARQGSCTGRSGNGSFQEAPSVGVEILDKLLR